MHSWELLRRRKPPAGELGYEADGFSLEKFGRIRGGRRAEIDFIFTVCDNVAGEICPIWPGKR